MAAPTIYGIKKVFASKLTEVTTTAKEPLGTIRFEGNKVYKYVMIKNTTATVAGAAGDPVCYAKASDNGYRDHWVVLDLSDADAVVLPIFAGVLCGTVVGTLATAYYGWVQIKGHAIVLTAITSGVVGDGVITTTTDKTLAVEAAANIVGKRAGIELTATGASNEIILDEPF